MHIVAFGHYHVEIISKLQKFWYRRITIVDRFRCAANAICLWLAAAADTCTPPTLSSFRQQRLKTMPTFFQRLWPATQQQQFFYWF